MSRRVWPAIVALMLVAAACGDDDAAPTTTSAITQPPAADSTTTSLAADTTVAGGGDAAESEVVAYIEALGAPGDCFDVAYAGGDFDYSVPPVPVPCDGPHDHVVFHVGELPGDADAPYPGDDALLSMMFDDVCIPEYSAIFGDWNTTYTLSVWAAGPFEAEWDAGIRSLKCSVTTWDGAEATTKLIGSVATAEDAPADVEVLVVAEFDERDFFLYSLGADGAVTTSINVTMDGNDQVEDTALPSWSPDGSMVAYGGLDPDAEGEQWDLWLFDITTGEKTQLNDDAPADAGPQFSPDGSQLLFTSRNRAQDERDIWVMDIESREMTQLTSDPAIESSAHWSPDGSQIVYRKNVGGSNDIWLMNADGSDQRAFVDLGGDEFDPRFSPSGDQIAFISDVGGDFDIYVVGLDGADPVNLTNHPANDEYPSWSPDGAYILFNTNRRGVEGLWVMRADGSGQTDLTRDFPTGWAAVRP